MGKSKKVFIDRKNAVTFHLVHRSQHDPLVADETAPQRVLVEAASRQQQTEEPLDPSKRQAEQRKYGILYDDDYNYLQHLKKPEQTVAWEYVENPNHARKRVEEGQVTTAPKINLPSSVFASEYEEDVGLLNKAAPHPGPRPDWDPDVVAALDDDFDFGDAENQLDDDFVLKAMGDENEDDDDFDEEEEQDFDSDDLGDDDEDDMENDSEIMDRLAPLMRERRFDDEETKSRFTEYSMSSSVIRRNEQLSLLDDRFERFYASYDDPELGDLAMEDIEGSWGQKHPYVLGCFKEFKKSNKIEEYNKEWDKERVKQYRFTSDGDNDDNEEMDIEETKPKKWDCESILSTYSNSSNLPQMIKEESRQRRNSKSSSSTAQTSQQVPKIEIDPKTGLPTNVLRGDASNQLTAKALAKLEGNTMSPSGPKSLCDKSMISALSVLSMRPKDETPEEKRERKRLLKDYRSERRIEKKANSEAFKQEKKRQTHIKLNQRSNQQGNTIV